MSKAYFRHFEHRSPPRVEPMSKTQELRWQFLAGVAVATGTWYLQWRWAQSLNFDNFAFSIAVVFAETMFFIGTLLFFYDIWQEGDTAPMLPPRSRMQAGLDQDDGLFYVDIFFTTLDESPETLEPSVLSAQKLRVSPEIRVRTHVLDDGNRSEIRSLAVRNSANYITRLDNQGFKAGNLRHALFQTSGDFVVICDADTRLFPSFLMNTLGYFQDPKVAWVQTPHWFYDIPEGELWEAWLARHGFPWAEHLAVVPRWLTGQSRIGRDPFMSDPSLFFDVVQRRRNRHNASFCCGAASVHRREAIFDHALNRKADDLRHLGGRVGASSEAALLRCVALEPFRFHVSEDIYTSILLHGDKSTGWKSVYHPNVEAQMLSPWSLKAWATQRLKYAGGTFDIMIRDNPLFKNGMPWRTKLHYAATFSSYLNVLWAPILLFAPAVSLVFGISPVKAYSIEFFVHFLPAVAMAEIAVWAGMKGHDFSQGRCAAMAILPLNLRALTLVLRGKRPRFPTTPKGPGASERWRFVRPHIAMLTLMGCAGACGIVQAALGVAGFSMSMLAVNMFWLVWNMTLVGRIVLAALWRPEPEFISNHADFSEEADGAFEYQA